jgi:hypothetical protein
MATSSSTRPGTHDANHALRRPASEKRQGTKSRWVGHPVDAAGAMGIWAGGACQGDVKAAVRVIGVGQTMFVASTLKARPVGCAGGFGVGLRAGVAQRCKRERCRPSASRNGGCRCGGGSMARGS